MSALLILLYVAFAVGGSTLIKYGGLTEATALATIPIVNVSVSWITLTGVVSYGVSFILYILLLNMFDLSFISPLTIGAVYVLLMVTAVLVFNEHFTLLKTVGCTLILIGIMLVLLAESAKPTV